MACSNPFAVEPLSDAVLYQTFADVMDPFSPLILPQTTNNFRNLQKRRSRLER